MTRELNTTCTCGADLTGSIKFHTGRAPVAGAREPNPAMEPVPDAKCPECGEVIGAAFGIEAVINLYEIHDEPLPDESRVSAHSQSASVHNQPTPKNHDTE